MECRQELGRHVAADEEKTESSCRQVCAMKGSSPKLQRARRPGYGTSMKYRLKVVTNFYRLNFNKEYIYHYDIDIAPFDQKLKKFVMDDKMPGKEKCRQIMFELIKKEKQLEDYMPVYDGQKNLFTCKPLPIGEEGLGFEIPLYINGRKKLFMLHMKPVIKKKDTRDNVISLSALERYIRNETTVVPSEVQMVLETILSYKPLNSGYVRVVDTFFPPHPKTMPLGDGCDVWFGFNQTVRFTEDGASLVVNTTAMALHRSGPVLGKVEELFRGVPQTLDDRKADKLGAAMENVCVHVTHQRFKRKYRIIGIGQSARYQKIEHEDRGGKREMTVEEFFNHKYNKRLMYPLLPCLEMKSKEGGVYIPMEVCEILPGQRVGKLDAQKAGKMIGATAIPPRQRFKDIQKETKAIAESNAAHTSGYGLEIELDPTTTTARVLRGPDIAYHQRVSCKPNQLGVWNIAGRFAEPASDSKRWKLVSFVDRESYGVKKLQQLATRLMETLKNYGLDPDSPRIEICDRNDTAKSVIKEAKEKSKYDFIVFVLSSVYRTHIYSEIKFMGDVKYGIPTQCIDVAKGDPSTSKINNICLKLNTKLGGINHFLSEWPIALEKEGVIVFGADVVHNIAVGCPSVAAVVGSIDFTLSNYAVSCRAQSNPKGRSRSQEIIVDLEEMVKSILIEYYRSTRMRKPQKILFYRDGVSEGQYDHILQHEIPMIKQACRSLGSDYQPPTTFVIVQKRHSVRFRPEKEEEGVGRCRNVPPGSTVDRDIVDPVNHDFFLCSHEGIRGTSRPAHYTVLYDENGVKPDVIQELSYFLCHVCARCNRSISIPTPVKYADLLAYRAGLYVKFVLERSRRSVNPGDPIPDDIRQLMTSVGSNKCKLFFI